MRKILLMAVIFGGVFSVVTALSAGDFYRYKDKNGVIRFTDNILDVPPDQRKKAGIYEGVDSSPSPKASDGTGTKSGQAAPGKQKRRSASQLDQRVVDQLKAESERLNAKKAELVKEYSGLVQERDAIERDRQIAIDREAKHEVEKRAMKLNRKIRDYDRRSKAFEKELKAYNNRIKGGGD